MAKKILAIALIAIVAVSAAACFVACEEEPTPYADLVAVRVNNFMAEWENIDYNFTYEGSSALKVSVPYTNYLEVNDLIVSPGAEYKVYEDEGKTKQLTDLSKIYVDGTKTLYIDVTNGELSNSYSVDVTVEQTNLPPESEIADKQYDNRGGHIYIPDGAETVMIDGVEYTVQRETVDFDIDENVILASDSYSYRNEKVANYSSVFDGNGYQLEIDYYGEAMLDELREGGVVKNVIFINYNNKDIVYPNREFAQAICKTNYGTIQNVVNKVCYGEMGRVNISDAHTVYNYGYFAYENFGMIKNCLNVADVTTKPNNFETKLASFVTVNHADMYNCVNVGDVINRQPVTDQCGAATIAYQADDAAVFRGVYNLGECVNSLEMIKPQKYYYGDPQLKDMIFKYDGANGQPDLSKTKNYSYKGGK